MCERPFKDRMGIVSNKTFTKDEIFKALETSWTAFIKRTSFVECEKCRGLFLVNNQDFHQSKRCPNCR